MNLDAETREYLAEILEESVLELANISLETHSNTALQQTLQTAFQRLYELAEFCSFDALRHIVSWMQANLHMLQHESELLQQYNANGDFYLWVELLTVAVNHNDANIYTDLQSALQSQTWLVAIEPLALQGLLDALPQEIEQTNKNNTHDSDTSSYELAWDEDVHPELLDAFLQETPEQVVQTSVLIRQISAGSTDVALRQQAARLAHTVKGSSAVIGLTAVATFAHRLEDILDYSIENQLPNLVTHLLNAAADCLEALFESLLTKSPPPTAYPSLLAQLNQCLKHIETHSLNDKNVATFIQLHSPSDVDDSADLISVEKSTEDNVDTHYELAWDEDVHPELLEAYLSETPEYVLDIAQLLRKISASEVDKADYRKASRLAHTIKGTSAVVGIHAVAEFTHKLEDILEYTVDHPFPLALSSLLEESADLLESLYDSLLSETTPPPEFPKLDQRLSEWQQRLKQGLDENEAVRSPIIEDDENTSYKPRFSIDLPPLQDILPVVTPVKIQNKPQANTHLNSASLRIPLPTLEKLLNISSELITANTQMAEQIQQLLSDRQSMNERNERIRDMLDELEWVVDRQVSSGHKSLHKRHQTDFDALEMDSYNELHSITGLLSESVDDDRQINVSLTQQLRELKSQLHGQYQLNRELNSTVLDMRMEPVKTLLPRLERIVRETARETHKTINFVVKGKDLAIDTDVLKGLAEPLLHLLRNAIDHGIESPEIRTKLDKNKTGEIALSFTQKGDQVVVSLRDDGAGICADTVYQKALKLGLVDKKTSLSQDEKLRLILHAGFSTRTEITQVSGRGIGMDVVHTTLQDMAGYIRIKSQEDHGTEIQLQVPLTLVASNALLVQVSDNIVAIPSASIAQIYYVAKDTAIFKEQQWHITVQEQELPLYPLSHLLGWSVAAFDATINQAVLILKANEALYAVYIDKVLHSQEIILKSLKPWMDKLSGINGVCLLLKGVVAPVLDIPTLINTAPELPLSAIQPDNEPQLSGKDEIKHILVVDDSLSNRKALSLMIEPLGYKVLTAVDGSDALQKIENHRIDLVISDLEMPNMNGLEMVEFIRSETSIQHLPIIMVTSRSTLKHRKLAKQAGVNTYLTKPIDHETLNIHINHYFNNKKEKSLSANIALN